MAKPIDIVLRLMDPRADHAAVIAEAWREDCEEFFIGLDLALNPSYNFKLEKVPALPDDDEEPGTLTFAQFFNVAVGLSRERNLPEQVEQIVEDAAMAANAQEWNLWYRRILLKSLHKHLPMETIQKELIRLTTE